MKVLLTGSTGFLGSRILEKLSTHEELACTIAAARTERSWRQVIQPNVVYEFGDLTDPLYVDRIVKGCDAIIHTAALSSPWGTYEDFYRSNVEVQHLLLEAARKYGVKRFVYVSTPSMYFELKDKWLIKESDPLPERFINAYAQTKREAEIALEKSSVPFVSIRPRALLGRGDTIIMPRLIRAYEEGKLKIIGTGKNSVDLTPVSNVADAAILGLFVDEKGLNQVYNISNGAPVELWKKIDDVLLKLGKKLPSKRLPAWLVLGIARAMEIKSKLTNGKEPALTVYGVGTLTHSFTMDITKARQLLGYEPLQTVDEAIDEFVEWYRTHEEH